MRDAIGASIRQAKHQIKKFNGMDPQLFKLQTLDVQDEEDFPEDDNNDLVMDLENDDME